MEAWAREYVGIPYRFGADGRDGADCWGLVRMVLRERFGVDLPAFEHDDADPHRLHAIVDDALPTVGARRVPAPDPGDLALMRIIGEPCHIGVVTGDGYMLHTLHAHGSVLERYRDRKWAKRLEGFYRVR